MGLEVAPPSGVLTFLFTDIEGSTRRWEADPDEMRVALAAHDQVLREAIEAHGGWLFKHTGDGVVAAFEVPQGAVEAAVAAQRALDLPVRMGIATGEAQQRDADYFGPPLNRAARVMAAGHGGQILLADTTAGMITGVDLLDLGPRRLRDLASPVGLFQIRATGLRESFAPLRVLEANPGNLRPAVGTLIGRHAATCEVAGILLANRLVTLTGVGGVGKTRLGLEVAASLADKFPDGVWVFELASVSDPAAVPDAVASILGITQQPGKDLVDSVAGAQEDRKRLLVFDNCEHVLDDAADLIEAILARSTTVKILATSREGLRVPNEHVWPVPTLDVGSGVDSAAVTLFIERAQSVAPDVSFTKAVQADAVIEICRRLDGLPLAIELAASRIASMTAIEVRDRLDQRFRLLVGSRRGQLRHQTLRQTVAWSYDQLEDAEQALLDRCSVFAGGFNLDSACAVASGDTLDSYAVLDLLDALVRKSLVVADRTAERTRYSILETIRQFGDEQLAARGEASQARAAHARYFSGHVPDAFALWDSVRQPEAYTWFTVELPNLRAAFRWAADHIDELGFDVAGAIASYAFIGLWVENYEPLAWAEELIEPAKALDHPRLGFLYVLASQCWNPGRIFEAVRYTDEGQAAILAGDYDVPFGGEGWLGTAYLILNQPDRMADFGRTVMERGHDSHSLTRINMTFALAVARRSEEALAAAEGLLAAAEATDNPYVLSFALWVYGYALREERPIEALEALRRGMAISKRTGNRTNETYMAGNLALLESAHGDPLAAFDAVTLVIANFHDAGNAIQIQTSLAVLATLFERFGRYEPAATVAGFANSPVTGILVPELNTAIAHLREVLGEPAYEALAGQGQGMPPVDMLKYAYDQIDQGRAYVNRDV
jgi:predicted ATPase/class 3 adenylate cyclase